MVNKVMKKSIIISLVMLSTIVFADDTARKKGCSQEQPQLIKDREKNLGAKTRDN
jgi:hypothetical protein